MIIIDKDNPLLEETNPQFGEVINELNKLVLTVQEKDSLFNEEGEHLLDEITSSLETLTTTMPLEITNHKNLTGVVHGETKASIELGLKDNFRIASLAEQRNFEEVDALVTPQGAKAALTLYNNAFNKDFYQKNNLLKFASYTSQNTLPTTKTNNNIKFLSTDEQLEVFINADRVVIGPTNLEGNDYGDATSYFLSNPIKVNNRIDLNEIYDAGIKLKGSTVNSQVGFGYDILGLPTTISFFTPILNKGLYTFNLGHLSIYGVSSAVALFTGYGSHTFKGIWVGVNKTSTADVSINLDTIEVEDLEVNDTISRIVELDFPCRYEIMGSTPYNGTLTDGYTYNLEDLVTIPPGATMATRAENPVVMTSWGVQDLELTIATFQKFEVTLGGVTKSFLLRIKESLIPGGLFTTNMVTVKTLGSLNKAVIDEQLEVIGRTEYVIEYDASNMNNPVDSSILFREDGRITSAETTRNKVVVKTQFSEKPNTRRWLRDDLFVAKSKFARTDTFFPIRNTPFGNLPERVLLINDPADEVVYLTYGPNGIGGDSSWEKRTWNTDEIFFEDLTQYIYYTETPGKIVTVHATEDAEPGSFYEFKGQWYYVAKDLDDLNEKLLPFKNLSNSAGNRTPLEVTDDFGIVNSIPAANIVTTFVESFQDLFKDATNFNQDIGQWDTSEVKDMSRLFYGATNFNQDIGDWDVSSVTDLGAVFSGAVLFNQNINLWNLINVTNMDRVFNNALAFNKPINSWNVSGVTSMIETFKGTKVFNETLSDWDTGKVTNMGGMFNGALAFNKPIGDWDTSSVTNMSNMFNNTNKFNQPIGNWNVSKVTTMVGMFQNAKVFNKDIGWWDVLSVTNMSNMFNGASKFNVDISDWETDNVSNMIGMFNGATVFNQDLDPWCVSLILAEPLNFKDSNGVWTLDKPNWGTCFKPSLFIGFRDRPDGGRMVYAKPAAVVGTLYEARDEWWYVVKDYGDIKAKAALYHNLPNQGTNHNIAIDITDDFGVTKSIPINNLVTTRIDSINIIFQNATTFNQRLDQWDTRGITTTFSMFSNAESFNQDIGQWDFSKVINASRMFNNTKAFNKPIDLWNTAAVTNMSNMFSGAETFNQPIGIWNLTNVTDTFGMFRDAKAFDQDIGDWNVSKVTNMSSMFNGALSFKQNIRNWNVHKVTDMNLMFAKAVLFNSPLEIWNVRNVTNMANMFNEAKVFNQVIGGWVVSKVTNMSSMFSGALAFDQPMNVWDTSNVTNMSGMFSGTPVFNRPLDQWDVSKVTNMSNMFKDALVFNGNITTWNVSSVTDMSGMFFGAKVFNQDIGNWDTGEVANMKNMFRMTPVFNKDISRWEVDNVSNMEFMFYGALIFNQNLDPWCVEQIPEEPVSFWSETSVWLLPKPNWGFCTTETEFIGFTLHADGVSTVYAKPPAVNGVFYKARGQWWYVVKDSEDLIEKTALYVNLPGQESNNKLTANITTDLGVLKTIPINNLVTTRVTGMLQVFSTPTENVFNQNVSRWDTSSVTNMFEMFSNNTVFNQNITNWDLSKTLNTGKMFNNAKAFNQDISRWDVSKVTNMSNMFKGAISFNIPIGNWDIGSVVTTVGMFNNAKAFNNPIGIWNVSNVIDMEAMFNGAIVFNNTLEEWDVAKVANMNTMFKDASKFNQNLSPWCVTLIPSLPNGFDLNATDYVLPRPNWGTCFKPGDFIGFVEHAVGRKTVFAKAPAVAGSFYEFKDEWWYVVKDLADLKLKSGPYTTLPGQSTNHNIAIDITDDFGITKSIPINNLVTTRVLSLNTVFQNKTEFNQDIGQWDTSNFVFFSSSFNNATNFNQDIGDWNTSKVTNATSMFDKASNFNQDIGRWDVSNVTNMSSMFQKAKVFNQDIGDWDTGKVTNMGGMFGFMDGSSSVADFNQDISRWDVSNVTNTSNMFQNASVFDQDISGWDTGKVSNMNFMFKGAASFNQDLDPWCVTLIPSLPNGFDLDATAYVLPRPNWGTCFKPSLFIGFRLHPDGGKTVYAKPAAVGGTFYEFRDEWWYVVKDYGDIKAKAALYHNLPNQGTNHNIAIPITDNFGVTKSIPINNLVTTRVPLFPVIFQNATTFNQRLDQWDVSNASTLRFMFRGAKVFNQPIGNWDVSSVTDLDAVFSGAEAFNQDISRWDVSKVTNMDGVFLNARAFNQDIGNWNTSNVTKMANMFRSTVVFNKPINDWDVSKVTTTDYMFYTARAFNQPINDWDVGDVTTMEFMFAGADNFDQPIGGWNVAKVTNMRGMFGSTDNFNQDLNAWDVSKVTNMSEMFQMAKAFKQDLNAWDVSSVINMSKMFFTNRVFNHDITTWNVSSVTNTHRMFDNADLFNQDITNWNVGNVTDMSYMFSNTKVFNQPIGVWNVSNVTDMSHMFNITAVFDQDIGDWDTSKVTNTSGMFNRAFMFNKDISRWDVSKVTNMSSMFNNTNKFNQPIGNWNVSKVTNMIQMFQDAKAFNQNLSGWCVTLIPTLPNSFDVNAFLWTSPRPNWGTCP